MLSRPMGRSYYVGAAPVQPGLVAYTGGIGFGSSDPIDSTFTVASNVSLMIVLTDSSNAQRPSSITWDQGGTNQPLTRLTAADNGLTGIGADPQQSLWYLLQPTVGVGKTLRISNPVPLGIAYAVMTFSNTALTAAAAIPTADIKKGGSLSANTWVVTQSSGENISFSTATKLGVIFSICANGSSSNATWTPTNTEADGFRGMGFYVSTTSPMTMLVTPNSPPDGLAGLFFTVASA